MGNQDEYAKEGDLFEQVQVKIEYDSDAESNQTRFQETSIGETIKIEYDAEDSSNRPQLPRTSAGSEVKQEWNLNITNTAEVSNENKAGLMVEVGYASIDSNCSETKKKTSVAIKKTKEQSYQCDICNEVFQFVKLLKQHKRGHGKKFHCDKCAYKTSNEKFYTNHCIRHTRTFGCNFCDKIFKTRVGLRHHRHLHEGLAKCYVCQKTFPDKVSLEEHKSTHTLLQCDICQYVCLTKSVLKNHVQRHYLDLQGNAPPKIKREKIFRCPVCKYGFPDRDSLAEHKKTHTKLICDVCNYSTIRKWYLVKHMETHEQKFPRSLKAHQLSRRCTRAENEHKSTTSLKESLIHSEHRCNCCDRLFKTHAYKRAHEKRYHERLLKCSACHKNFSNKVELAEHKATHAKLMCDLCDFVTIRKDDLSNHMCEHAPAKMSELNSHEDNSPLLKCDQCPYVTNRYQNLNRHAKMHLQPSKCKLCGMQFDDMAMMSEHSCGDDGLAFLCRVCSQRFPTRHMLTEHRATHAKLTCDFCPFATIHASAMSRHARCHPQDQTSFFAEGFFCDVCHKVFPSDEALTEHQATHVYLQCKFCSYSSLNSYHFNKHLKIHSREDEKHTCDVCHKAFHIAANMMRHRRLHSEPHKCHCKARFPDEESLRRHQSTCTKSKCTDCLKLFPSAALLEEHKASKPYRCELCPFTGCFRSRLTFHLKTKHPKNFN